tara:strand:- start:3519 stop:3800 length:282 start_codon:yes stop_codon:yes gene_type:complete
MSEKKIHLFCQSCQKYHDNVESKKCPDCNKIMKEIEGTEERDRFTRFKLTIIMIAGLTIAGVVVSNTLDFSYLFMVVIGLIIIGVWSYFKKKK